MQVLVVALLISLSWRAAPQRLHAVDIYCSTRALKGRTLGVQSLDLAEPLLPPLVVHLSVLVDTRRIEREM